MDRTGCGLVAPFHIWGALNLNVLNFDAELEKAKRKIKRGVQAFLTQPVFTEQSIKNLQRARETLEGVYILGGLLPVVSHRSAVYMNNEVAGIAIPEDVVEQYAGADKDRCRALAIEHTLRLAKEIRPLVDGYYLITPAARPLIGCEIVRKLREMEKQRNT